MNKAGKMLPKMQAGALPARGGFANASSVVVETTVTAKAAGELRRFVATAGDYARREQGQIAELGEVLYRALKSFRGMKSRNRECALTEDWMRSKVAGACEATGLAFGAGPWAPVVVRRDPGASWTAENCLVVCAMYAAALGTGRANQVLQMAFALAHKEGLE
jgi:hypothetical protein